MECKSLRVRGTARRECDAAVYSPHAMGARRDGGVLSRRTRVRSTIVLSGAAALMAAMLQSGTPHSAEAASVPSRDLMSASPVGLPGNDHSSPPVISANGQVVAFSSFASNLVVDDPNDKQDVFVRSIATGETKRLTTPAALTAVNGDVGGESFGPSLSADGQKVAFLGRQRATADSIVADAYLYDAATEQVMRISRFDVGVDPDGPVIDVDISGDGNSVAFTAYPDDELAGSLTHGLAIFVFDGASDRVTQVTSTAPVPFGASDASLSKSGRFVAYESFVALDAGPSVIVKDLQTGNEITVADDATNPSLSADGNAVTFEVMDSNEAVDVFVAHLKDDRVERVSASRTGGDANGNSYGPDIDDDGSHVVFTSAATNLTPGLTAGDNVFVRDVVAGVTTRVPSVGRPNIAGGIDGSGEIVGFTAMAVPRKQQAFTRNVP
jgi:Tol biopolymer transport system component